MKCIRIHCNVEYIRMHSSECCLRSERKLWMIILPNQWNVASTVAAKKNVDFQKTSTWPGSKWWEPATAYASHHHMLLFEEQVKRWKNHENNYFLCREFVWYISQMRHGYFTKLFNFVLHRTFFVISCYILRLLVISSSSSWWCFLINQSKQPVFTSFFLKEGTGSRSANQ